MIHQSTHLTARTFGIPKRGLIAEGYFADLLIFKPEAVIDNATFESPAEYSEGMEWIILNGELVVQEGMFTNQLAGRAIRKQ